MNFLDPRLPARFWSKVVPEPNSGCWLWIGAHNTSRDGTQGGYGKFGITAPRSTVFAHRFSYESLVGPIAAGLQIDHRCRVRCCVNPLHLDPVSQKENLLRGTSPSARRAAASVCVNGHEFSEDNVYIHPKRGGRHCRACIKERNARRYRK